MVQYFTAVPQRVFETYIVYVAWIHLEAVKNVLKAVSRHDSLEVFNSTRRFLTLHLFDGSRFDETTCMFKPGACIQFLN